MKRPKRSAAPVAPVPVSSSPAPAAPVPAPEGPRTPEGMRLPLVLAGAALLCLPVLLGLAGPERAPGAGDLVAWLCVAGAALAALPAMVPALRVADAPTLAVLGGGGALVAALGLAPETFGWPTAGIGERFVGFPTLVGLPLAGAALLAAGDRQLGRVVAGAASALTLAGLLQPFAVLSDTAPALVHALGYADSVGALVLMTLTTLAALGLFSPVLASSKPLRWALGGALLAVLPAAQLLRLVDGAPAALPCAAIVLGAGLVLLEGLRGGLELPRGRWALRAGTALEAAVLLCVVGLYVLLKSFTWRWSTTDENIYFYAANALTRGVLPYRDFFFAHPPMHLVVPALVFQIFGFSIGVAKAIPVVATLLTGGLLWHLARLRLGAMVAACSLVAFLFGHELLQASTNMNGVELTSLWLTAGLWATLMERPRLAGVMLGLAVTTGFYSVAGALALLAMSTARNPRFGLRLGVAFVAVAGGINLLFWGVGRGAFLEGVYGYHMAKENKPLIGEFLKTTYHHAPLVLGLVCAPLIGAWQRFTHHAPLMGRVEPEVSGSFFAPHKLAAEPALGTIKVAWLVALALVAEFTLFQELYSFYFALIFPTAALCTGYTVAGLAGSVVYGLRELGLRRRLGALGVAAGLSLVYGMWVPLAVETNWAFSNAGPPGVDASGKRERFPRPAKGLNPEWLQQGERRDYPWIAPAALDPWASRIVRALFWRDHRLKAALTPGYRHFLWQKALYFDAAEALGQYVNENAAADETVAGNSLVAPVVALTSGRRIAGEYVDTNGKRYNSGLEKLQTFFETICNDKIRYLVAAPSGFMSDALFSRVPTVTRYFQPAKQFASAMNKFDKPGAAPFMVTLWEVKDPSAEPRCTWLPGSPVP